MKRVNLHGPGVRESEIQLDTDDRPACAWGEDNVVVRISPVGKMAPGKVHYRT